MVVYVLLFLCCCQLAMHPICLPVMEEGMTGPCLTKTLWCCHKPFSHWQHSFHLKAVLPLAKMLVTSSQFFSDTRSHPLSQKMDADEGRKAFTVVCNPSFCYDGAQWRAADPGHWAIRENAGLHCWLIELFTVTYTWQLVSRYSLGLEYIFLHVYIIFVLCRNCIHVYNIIYE